METAETDQSEGGKALASLRLERKQRELQQGWEELRQRVAAIDTVTGVKRLHCMLV